MQDYAIFCSQNYFAATAHELKFTYELWLHVRRLLANSIKVSMTTNGIKFLRKLPISGKSIGWI